MRPDFFEQQAASRARRRKLLLLFALAVVAVVAGVALGMRLAWHAAFGATPPPRWFHEINLLVPLLLVVGGAWVEGADLRHGGAQALVGRIAARPVDPMRPLERRLRNCVEEVSVAAGLPVPRVHVLDDDAINAMAVGFTPTDAALVFTRGALERLSRDELQGIVAHEMGHVAAGDMRLNTQLLGWVWGLELLWRLGLRMLWTDRSSGHGRGGRSTGVLAVVGVLLYCAGALGWLAARMLKAAANREAEFHADARALQWTRSRDGIGGALRRVKGQTAAGTRLAGDDALAFSHCWLVAPAAGWLDTHPPLEARIRRIYGRPMGALDTRVLPDLEPATSLAPIEWPADAPVASGAGLEATISAPLPHALLEQPAGAVALLSVLVEREQAHAAAAAAADPRLGHALAAWRAQLVRLEDATRAAWRLPLLELACARLRDLAPQARTGLVDAMQRACDADGRVTPLEALLLVVMRHRLADGSIEGPGRRHSIAHPIEASRAAATCGALLGGASPARVDAHALRTAVETVAALPMLAKPAVVRGWQRRIDADAPDAAMRIELLQALCAAIDCPSPLSPPGAAGVAHGPTGVAGPSRASAAAARMT